MVDKSPRPFSKRSYFAIVDEVDSILIDEARTPLIISGAGMKSSEAYYSAQRFVKNLKEDFEIEIEKLKTIHLTESGIQKPKEHTKLKICQMFNILNFQPLYNNALKANYIMKRDENYISKDDEIILLMNLLVV